MPKRGYIQSEEHKQAISKGMKQAFQALTEDEHKRRLEKRRNKARLKEMLYNNFINKSQLQIK